MSSTIYNKTRKTYNALGRAYVLSVEPLVPEERKAFAKRLGKGARLLDVGCAGGRDTEFFVKQGFRVTGVDASKVFIRIAKRRVPTAKFSVMDIRKMPDSLNNFDAVWANAVLLHLQRKEVPKVLRNFSRILVPHGLLHIRVKLGRGSGWVIDSLVQQPRFFTYFTKTEMLKMIREAGFRIVKSQIISDEKKRKEVRWLSVEAKSARGLVMPK